MASSCGTELCHPLSSMGTEGFMVLPSCDVAYAESVFCTAQRAGRRAVRDRRGAFTYLLRIRGSGLCLPAVYQISIYHT
ncbi:MAG: hypothetical protein ACK53Y_19750 [bacterium]